MHRSQWKHILSGVRHTYVKSIHKCHQSSHIPLISTVIDNYSLICPIGHKHTTPCATISNSSKCRCRSIVVVMPAGGVFQAVLYIVLHSCHESAKRTHIWSHNIIMCTKWMRVARACASLKTNERQLIYRKTPANNRTHDTQRRVACEHMNCRKKIAHMRYNVVSPVTGRMRRSLGAHHFWEFFVQRLLRSRIIWEYFQMWFKETIAFVPFNRVILWGIPADSNIGLTFI